MKITNIDMIVEIERLAEAFPWDPVQLEIRRTPEGTFNFCAYVPRNEKFGFESVIRVDGTPQAAVDDCLLHAPSRNPAKAREQKLAELKAQIEKLQAVVIGMPPFRSNRTLCNGEPAIEVKETVDV
jgi:hypothetical protein